MEDIFIWINGTQVIIIKGEWFRVYSNVTPASLRRVQIIKGEWGI